MGDLIKIKSGRDYVEEPVKRAEWTAYAAANGLTGDWRRAYRYGMTPVELHAMYIRQDGRCYLCRDPLPATLAKVAIDHDHACCGPGGSCGACVRGIACGPCNRLIAGANDDPRRLRVIADNLEAAHRQLGRRYAAKALNYSGPIPALVSRDGRRRAPANPATGG